tara:strand:- start:614 stop:1162 length:549 start_codon:yes stop_codon:yes gene_type:complete
MIGLLACGSEDSSDVAFTQINPSEKVYTLEDLKSLGVKKGKTYKVKDLKEAESAYFVFYKKAGSKEAIEYEIRFYPNHDLAMSPGLDIAKERVGPDAKLKKDEATWVEGLKDARQCGGAGGGVSGGGVGAAGDHAVGSCSSPKYNEYFVIGNMIALCQGENETESRIHCVDLLTLIQGNEVE